jgi:hypothetical protein
MHKALGSIPSTAKRNNKIPVPNELTILQKRQRKLKINLMTAVIRVTI